MELEFDSPAARGLRRYVGLVARACGSGMDCSFIELERPVSAYLPVDGRIPGFPDLDVALCWQEGRGWAAGVETHSAEELVLLTHLDGDVLPDPQRVARFLCDVRGGDLSGGALPEPPGSRGTEDPLERLAGYDQSELVH